MQYPSGTPGFSGPEPEPPPGVIRKGTFFGESGSTGRLASHSRRPLSEELRQGGGGRSERSEWNRADWASDGSRPIHWERSRLRCPAGRRWTATDTRSICGQASADQNAGNPVRERIPASRECGILAAAGRYAVRGLSADAGGAPSPRPFRSAIESRRRIVRFDSGKDPRVRYLPSTAGARDMGAPIRGSRARAEHPPIHTSSSGSITTAFPPVCRPLPASSSPVFDSIPRA